MFLGFHGNCHGQAKEALEAQLKALEEQMAGGTDDASSTATPTVTPAGRRCPAPSPASTVKSVAKAKAKGSDASKAPAEAKDQDVDATEAAKNNRLRRLCEKKPSGRCHVPPEVHEQWKKGGAERLKLRDELEECGWDKDCTISTFCI